MGEIDPTVITHRPNVSPSFKPVKQKRRSFTPDRKKAINEKVGKLLQAGAIREVEYPEWLANVVLVKKENDKWRLCIDFTDINRACPKDSFPLPQIELAIDATAGHELLSFMDAFSGYNQISMDPDDQVVRHGAGNLLLSCDAFWTQERRSYLPEVGKQNVPEADRNNHGGVHR